MTSQEFLKSLERGDLRALGRLISLAENQDPLVWEVLANLYPKVGRARRIGITGPPGAGKSTLTGHFVRYLRGLGKKVGVVAVDPMSPFSGGAILGDRIRLVDHFNDPGVFIRSLSTRGKLGGLSLATRQVIHLMDAFGLDYLIVESVGVGQSEIDIRKIADITLVVLVPEWGDAVQALKAGILEIADYFVVNKADREGADRIVTELKSMLQLTHRETIRVFSTTQTRPETIEDLFKSLEQFLDSSQDEIKKRREDSARETLSELLEMSVFNEVRAWVNQQKVPSTNPYHAFFEFRKLHPQGSLFS